MNTFEILFESSSFQNLMKFSSHFDNYSQDPLITNAIGISLIVLFFCIQGQDLKRIVQA